MIFWPLRFGCLLVLGLYKEDYLRIFKCLSFLLHMFCGKLEGWDPANRFILGLYKEDYLRIFKCLSFSLHMFCG